MGELFDQFVDGLVDFGKKAGDVAMNMITLGGSSAIENSKLVYQRKYDDHRKSVQVFETSNDAFKKAIESLGRETAECITLLKDARDFVDRLSYSKYSSKLPNVPQFRAPNLSNVTQTISEFNAAVTAGQGAGIGIAASTGAWVLVAHLGTASTGAAISGLGGIAAHNAILAWFGGGAVVAGGGGMLLGAVAVGAIVLVPLLGFSAYRSYAEARRLDEEATKIEDSAKTNLENAKKLDELKLSVSGLQTTIKEKRTLFATVFAECQLGARKLAEDAAAKANAFADSLVNISKVKGAFN